MDFNDISVKKFFIRSLQDRKLNSAFYPRVETRGNSKPAQFNVSHFSPG